MSEISTLIEFQDTLMELLVSGLSEGEIIERLKSDPRFSEEFGSYVEQFDADMVAVACELVSSWSMQKSEV